MNAKKVSIEGVIPFNFMDYTTPEEEAFLARMLLNPCAEPWIAYSTSSVEYRPSEHGQTAYYGFRIGGTYGGSWQSLRELADTLRSHGAEMSKSRAKDVQDTPSGWEPL